MRGFLFLIIILFQVALHSQDCYQRQFDHTGLEHLYSASLESKACSVRNLVQAEANAPAFPVLSYNPYRILAFVDGEEGYGLIRQEIERDLLTRPYYLSITKEINQAEQITYWIRIKLPQSYDQSHRCVQVEAYETILKNIGEEAIKNGSSSITAELMIMEHFAEFLDPFSMDKKLYEDAGYTIVPLVEGSLLRSSQNSTNNTSQYAKIEVKNPNSDEWIDIAEEVPTSLNILSYLLDVNLITSSTLLDPSRQDIAGQDANQKTLGAIHFTVHHDHNIGDAIFLKFSVHEGDASLIIEKQFELILSSYGIPIYSLKPGAATQNKQLAGALAVARNHIMPDLASSNFEGGIACGLLDGMLGSIEAIWELSKGVVKGTGSFFSAVWEGSKSVASYTASLIETGVKEGMSAVYLKLGKDAANEIEQVVAFINVVRNAGSKENIEKLWKTTKRILVEWFGGLTAGDKESGYQVGELSFDVVFTVLTAGSTSAGKGAVFLQ